VKNHGVDSARIEVHRRHRRAKTDRLDVHKLLTMWRRHVASEPKVWSGVRVPSAVDADRWQLHRELLPAKRERTRGINCMKG
jgi:transposase